MKRVLLLLSIGLCMLATPSWAQENCSNGIDDDGDNKIDCYDLDCLSNPVCDGFYLNRDADCSAEPPVFPQFTMTLDFASENETTNHIGRMVVGDLDRDGMPEIVTLNRYTRRLIILNGNDGSIKRSVPAEDNTGDGFTPLWEVAIGNIDNDNCAEIFFQGYDNSNELWLFSYDCNLNFLWKTRIRTRDTNNDHAIDAIMYALADFDGDGKVELYLKDMILDAHTGTIIINTATTNDDGWLNLNGGPVAADIMGNDKLELIVGCKIYDVNLGTRTANSGTLTLLKSLPNYFVRYPYNATSVADYNQDGFLDVLASGSTRDGSSGNPKNTVIFFWDVQNDALLTYADSMSGNFTIHACPDATGPYYQRGWRYGTGRLNIADLDGDGNLNIAYISGRYLYALDHNMNQLWRKEVNEETSGYTGCTLFDFNGDRRYEIVYRDERFLYIIDGTTGNFYGAPQPCISRTNREYPIVADVDADGSTEICITCGYDDQLSSDNFCTLDYAQYSHVRVFKSAAEPWVPARRVWNQHGYFNVNVNDNLTIPRKQQKHHLVWANSTHCTPGPNRPLNGFLNQSPYLDTVGCPIYATPNLAPVAGSLDITEPTCPERDFGIAFRITNLGDVGLTGNIPITFYNGDPSLPTTVRLNTITVSLSDLQVGDTITINSIVNGPGSQFDLYVVVNDAGTTSPIPASLPNTNFVECDYTDNILSGTVVPDPVAISAVKVADNLKCAPTVPDNGAVRAFVPTGLGENTVDYNFYWSNGTTGLPVPANFLGAVYSGRAAGTYTVYGIHKTASCSSDTTSVDVGLITETITVNVVQDNQHTNCVNPNGILRAVVNGGEPASNFDYEWYRATTVGGGPIISMGASASGLAGSKVAPGEPYTVIARDKVSGCSGIFTAYLLDETVNPVVVPAATPSICSGNSGGLTATVTGGPAGFTFNWYNGNFTKATTDFTGDNHTGKAQGNYTATVTNNTTGCTSAPVTVTVGQVAPPVASTVTTANQTSCDPTLPNGAVSANVGGVTAGFTFEWFIGQNTLSVNSISNTNVADSCRAGIYTVRVIDNATGCSDTEEATVINAIVTPTLSLQSVVNTTTCTNPNGSVTVNVSLDAPSDYTFFWYNGTTVKATTDYADTDNVLSGLPPGQYTVRARHNTKHCNAAPITATVLDNTPSISIVLNSTATVLPGDCNANNGSMTVSISSPGNTLGFDVQWFYGRAPFVDPAIATSSGVTTSQANNLRSGVYSVTAVDRNNGCQNSEEFDLPFNNAHELLFDSKTDVLQCTPNNTGQIQVELDLSQVIAPVTQADYEIHVYEGTNDGNAPLGAPIALPLRQIIAGGGGTAPLYSTTANLDSGYYTLVAISTSSLVTVGCRSTPVTVRIDQNTSNPVIAASQIDINVNCTGAAMGTGEIELSVDTNADPNNYNFQWFDGPDVSSGALPPANVGGTNGNTAQNLVGGDYTVQVTNNTATSNGCFSTASFTVFNNPPIMSLAQADITIGDVTRCDMNNSSVQVDQVLENGVTVPAVYSYEWFDDASVSVGSTNPINGLAAGNYTVRVTNTTSNCATTLVGFEIRDMTPGTVDVELTSFTLPTKCLKPADIQGQLVANAIGNSTTGYDYIWLDDVGASTGVSTPALSGITISAGQTSITHIVEVTNRDNNCTARDTLTLPLDVRPVTISVSSAPLTSCINDNGLAFATVTSGSPTDYDYNWSFGAVPKVVPDFNIPLITSLPDSTYTVIAVDRSEPTCQTTPQTVIVTDERVFPVVTAVANAPVVNCDPTRPNGVASASVGGDIINYEFDWFQGPTVTDPHVYTGVEAGQLQASIYTVRATHNVSGCPGIAQVVIEERLAAPPVVQIEILSQKTSCVEDNGALTASVNGNTRDYIFDWYIGNAVTATPDHTGEFYYDLPVGTYTVVATSRITGCVSAPVSEEIIDSPIYPDFAFLVVNASCTVYDGGVDGEPDGVVSLILNNKFDMGSVQWDVNGTIVNGPILSGVEAGTYSVTVTSALGCATTKQADVKTEIHAFNGISRDGDGRNDAFYINCIDNFPDNIVRIYNRAGTMVYEAHGYDNIDIYFDGRSNRGVSVMGTNLPDGTYFYVVDKMDGSKPIAGYLEIVN